MRIKEIIVDMSIKSKKAAENQQRILNWMNKDLDNMIEYYNHVYSEPQRIQLLQARCFDVTEYQEGVERLDAQRKEKHDAAISAVRDLDSCCKDCGFGSCIDEDLESAHRTEIADAIFEFCDKWVRKGSIRTR